MDKDSVIRCMLSSRKLSWGYEPNIDMDNGWFKINFYNKVMKMNITIDFNDKEK